MKVPLPEAAFVPTATALVDLDDPLSALELGSPEPGAPYGAVLALVRLHADPLALVELPLHEGRAEAGELADRIWGQARSALEEHVRSHGCVPQDALGRDALLDGLRSDRCPARVIDAESAPFVTVVVPTARRPERLRSCLETLGAMTYPRFDVVVSDNAPDDPSTRSVVEECARAGLPVRYVAEPRPGSSMARNRGLLEASSELVAFTDDDVEADPQWLSWMVEPLVADERVDAVTGLVLPATLATDQERWFEQFSGYGKGLRPRRFDTGPHRVADGLFPYWGARFGSGASMAFRRSALVAIGGFDPALGAGSPALAGADIEALSHVLIRGGRLAYEPRALCWHHHHATEAGLRRQAFAYAAGATAILTKWVVRKPGLAWQTVRAVGGLIADAGPRHRRGPRADPAESSRIGRQLRMSRERGLLHRQLAGYAVGPFLYARSIAWARRRHLRDAVPPGAA